MALGSMYRVRPDGMVEFDPGDDGPPIPIAGVDPQKMQRLGHTQFFADSPVEQPASAGGGGVGPSPDWIAQTAERINAGAEGQGGAPHTVNSPNEGGMEGAGPTLAPPGGAQETPYGQPGGGEAASGGDIQEEEIDLDDLGSLRDDSAAQPRPGRVQVIQPGGMAKVGVKVGRTIGATDPELEQLRDIATGEEIGDVERVRRVLAKGNMIKQGKQQMQLDQWGEGLARRAQDRVKINEEYTRRKMSRDQATEAAQAAAVNPNAFLKDAPTWKKAMAAISVAMLNYASALQGGSPTAGIDSLMRVWQGYNDEQQTKYENAKDFELVQDSRYKDYLAEYGTPEEAKRMLLIENLALTEGYVQLAMEQAQDAQQLAMLEGLKTQIFQRRLQEMSEIDARDAVRIEEQYGLLQPKVIGGGGGGGGKSMGRQITLPGSQDRVWTSMSEAATAKLSDQINSSYTMMNHASRALSLASKPDARNPTSATNAQLTTALRGFAAEYKQAKQMGALDKGLIEFLDQYTGTPQDVIQLKNHMAKLQEAQRIAARDYYTILETQVYQDEGANTPYKKSQSKDVQATD